MQSETWRAHVRYMRMQGLSGESTITARTGVMRRLADACGGRPLTELTETDLMTWAESLQPLALASRAVYLSHVRKFYAWCYADHRIPSDPAASLPRPRVPRRKPRPIPEFELAMAVDSATRVRAFLVLGAWCGLRAKEIALLRAENIRLNDQPPYILVTAEATKGHQERIIPLSEFVVAELRSQDLPFKGLCWKTLDGRPLTPAYVSKLCNRHLRDLGIGETLHQLRHRFGTQAQRSGHDIRITQELLGHRSPVTTAGYAEVADLDKYRVVSRLPSPATLTSYDGGHAAYISERP